MSKFAIFVMVVSVILLVWSTINDLIDLGFLSKNTDDYDIYKNIDPEYDYGFLFSDEDSLAPRYDELNKK